MRLAFPSAADFQFSPRQLEVLKNNVKYKFHKTYMSYKAYKAYKAHQFHILPIPIAPAAQSPFTFLLFYFFTFLLLNPSFTFKPLFYYYMHFALQYAAYWRAKCCILRAKMQGFAKRQKRLARLTQ